MQKGVPASSTELLLEYVNLSTISSEKFSDPTMDLSSSFKSAFAKVVICEGQDGNQRQKGF
jgi:hypothetical protein